jgi:hypothetical protein
MPPASNKFALSIDGKVVPAQNATGGYVKADVKTTFPSANGPPQRQISSFGYTNLQVKLGLDVGTPILNWINAALKGNPVTKNGTLIELDDQNRARSYLDFTNGAISGFAVPGFEASNNTANTFTLEASIGKSTLRPGDNTAVQLPNKLKPFLANNFRAGALHRAVVVPPHEPRNRPHGSGGDLLERRRRPVAGVGG